MSDKNNQCGATPEQVDIVRNLADQHRGESDRLKSKTTGSIPWNKKHSAINGVKANALEAILAEREELIGAIKDLLESDDNISSATDAELKDAEENGYAPEIRKSAKAILRARKAIGLTK